VTVLEDPDAKQDLETNALSFYCLISYFQIIMIIIIIIIIIITITIIIIIITLYCRYFQLSFAKCQRHCNLLPVCAMLLCT